LSNADLHDQLAGTRVAVRSDVTNLKSRFLAAIGHVCAANESPAAAFDQLRIKNPDTFPVPRCTESFLEACAEVVRMWEAPVRS
jgi:hypothetical protein